MNTTGHSVAGVILAAGESKRMGQPKALLRIQKQTFLHRIASCLKAAGCDPIVVVIGSDSDMIVQEAQKHNLAWVINREWTKGQFSSLKVGLAAVGDGKAALVALVDHPLVQEKTYQLLVDAYYHSPQRVHQIAFHGRKGHPVLLPPTVIAQILRSPGESNLKAVLMENESTTVVHECDDEGAVTDIDTPQDLSKAGLL